MCQELEKRGIEADPAPVCRVESEFASAVKSLEKKGADAIVTLHLAYSPSLESIRALAATQLPLVVLDTTPDSSYEPNKSPDDFIMKNHGIHGAQDLCNLLLRHGKTFILEASHWKVSDVLDRVADHARGARIASALHGSRTGIIGRAFRGMGDFSVESDKLKAYLGVTVVAAEPAEIAALLPDAKDPR
ncbi:MAG: hypothetical protein QME60_06705 [Verrucomicrobiota bacterium]|nr:hypothetical protein [Verrucomicrobiota bacterium]